MDPAPPPERPRVSAWEILRAEHRRLREPPELSPVVHEAIRSRPVLLALLVPGVLAVIGLAWWLADQWVATVLTFGGLSFLGALAKRPPRRRDGADA